MDSSARLDYALFQLTPTRTRCELVVFSGGSNEKLASGLVDPFISHLRCAKEQIPKGGYSITLRPPTSNASWFTKGTLERFVRFVSTPEVLERFVTIEREISQIEISISISTQSNDSTVTVQTDEGSAPAANVNAKTAIVPYKPKGESNEKDEAQQGENSKLRLQKVLETRKVVLRKEQAMAYARAFVAGFDMDCLDDLISFADAFGASRLREACINFKELCHKKHNDGLWMDELAAVQAFVQPELPYLATSGIILAGDGGLSNGPFDPNASLDASVSDSTPSPASSDINQGNMPPTTAKAQGSMPWPNNLPPFMYNFQQMPPYQGYPFPGMQGVPPYYPGNMQWPPNAEESGRDLRETDYRRNRKSSSRKKEKFRNDKESEPSEGEYTETSDSTSGSEVEHDKKHSSTDQHRKKRNGKKSSRTVVIRNINYITSNKKDGEDNGVSNESSSGEDDFIDGTSLKQKVEDAVGSLEKHHKSRHSKKRGGNKNLTVTNDSNGEADHDLEDDPVTMGGKTNNNWDSFQNLLMRDDKNEVEKHQALDVRDEYFAIKGSDSGSGFVSSHAIDPESEKGIKQRMIANDSLVLTERDADNNRSTHLENFESNASFRPSMVKRDSRNEELLFSHRINDSERNVHDTYADGNTEFSGLKTKKGEDWFIVDQSEKTRGRDSTKESSIFDGDQALTAEKHNKDSFVDYSIMVQSRSFDDQPDSQWKTDISMISDLTGPSQVEMNTSDVSVDKQGVSGKYEPDDLCMVLERDIGVEPTGASWTPEIDYAIDLSFTEAEKRHSSVETADLNDNKLPSNGKTTSRKEAKLSDTKSKPRAPLWKSKHEIISRPKKPSTVSRAAVQKSKAEKEEETRKRMEEIVIERQKRIAERSAARGLTAAASKTSPVESKTAEKQSSKSTTQEAKRLSLPKPGITSSTIDRLASPQVKNKGPSTPSPKSTPPKKPSSKVNGTGPTNLSPKVSDDENNKVTSSEQKVINGSLSSPSNDNEEFRTKLHTSESIATSKDQKELYDPSSTIMKNNHEMISDVNVGKSSDPAHLDSIKMQNENEETSKVTSSLQGEKTVDHGSQINGFNSVRMEDHFPTAPEKSLNSTADNFQVEIGATNQTLPVTSEISEEVIIYDPVESVSPIANGVSPDSTHTRKKWSSNESTPPIAKGLKKLLMFGRKNNISATS